MDPNFLGILARILDSYFAVTGDILQENAYQTALRAYIAADTSLGIKSGAGYYSKAADAYAQEYGQGLIDRGGSYVYDVKAGAYVFKPWFQDANTSVRESVADIIRQGIKDGKPLGSRESGKGNYPKGTIAYDIDQEFDKGKSWASTVARTEIGNIQNEARLLQLQNRGVQRVRVWDNEGPNSCDECGRANQQEWDIDFALDHMLEHPNCVRRFQAILEGVRITAKQEEELEYLSYHPFLMKAGVGLLA